MPVSLTVCGVAQHALDPYEARQPRPAGYLLDPWPALRPVLWQVRARIGVK